MIETDLGCVTAYADAVAQGYTGTRKEFGQVLANFADSATQVAADRTVVEAAKASVEEMQLDVAQKQETATSNMNTTVEAAEKAKQSASDAEASKQAAAQSEQNINNTVTAFDNHVEEKIAGFDSRVFEAVEQSKEEINTTKQQAIDTITNQQDASVNIVKTEGEKIITKVGNDAKTVADDRTTVEEATQTVLNNAQEVAQNTQTVASNTEKAAASAEGAKTSADNAAQSAKSVEDASKQIEQNKKDVDSLKEDLGNINDVLEIVEKQNYSPKAATISKAYTPVKMQENISLKKNKTYRFYFKIDGKKSDHVYCHVIIKGEEKSAQIATGKLESEFIYKAEENIDNVYTQTQADGSLIGTVVTSYIECLDDVNSKNKIEKLQYNINDICNEFDSCFYKKNLFNKNGNLLIGKALVSYGELAEADKYITSNLIFVKKGDLLSIYPKVFSFAFYDTNKIFDNTYFNNEDTQKPMNVPAAPYDGYIRVTLYKSDLEVFTIGYGAINQPYDFNKIEITDKIVPDFRNDFLNNKKWAVCGDSFTAGATDALIDNGKYYGFPKTYPYFIGNRTGINIINFHNSGQTLAYPASHDFTNSLTCPNSDRYYQNIPTDVDYITIYLGINDESHAVGNSDYGKSVTGIIPIGTITDNDTSTYYGAWNVVLSWLIENRPKAHIGIIISNGLTDVAYRNAQLEIAKKYGIPFIDLNGDSNTPAMIRSCNPDIDSDVKEVINKKWRVSESNTHPNDDAHEYESYFIENFLRSI